MDKQNKSIKGLKYSYDIMLTTNKITGQNSLQQQNFNTMIKNI